MAALVNGWARLSASSISSLPLRWDWGTEAFVLRWMAAASDGWLRQAEHLGQIGISQHRIGNTLAGNAERRVNIFMTQHPYRSEIYFYTFYARLSLFAIGRAKTDRQIYLSLEA